MALFKSGAFTIEINGKGIISAFTFRDGTNLLGEETPFAFSETDGDKFAPIFAEEKDDGLTIAFENGDSASFAVRQEKECVIFTVSGASVAEKLRFCNICPA